MIKQPQIFMNLTKRRLDYPQTPKNKKSKKNLLNTFESEQDDNEDQLAMNYQSTRIYSLDTINSFTLKNGTFYNLLQRKGLFRTVKCGCSKSNCEAKYCECFRWGEACGVDCLCRNCNNKKARHKQSPIKRVEGCNCVKSYCEKKYCQCFQGGNKCGKYCNCVGCKNK